MSYLQKSLASGESVVAVFRLHWIAWIRLWVVLILGAIALAALAIAGIAWGALAVGVLAVLVAGCQWLWLRGIEQAVTSRRVVRKIGIVSRATTELRLASIETVDLRQGVWGRILGFGDVEITGRGETAMVLHRIADPIAAKRDVESAYSAHVENAQPGSTA